MLVIYIQLGSVEERGTRPRMESEGPVPSIAAGPIGKSNAKPPLITATGIPDIGHQPRVLSLDEGGVRGSS
jgi:hypothetical protein